MIRSTFVLIVIFMICACAAVADGDIALATPNVRFSASPEKVRVVLDLPGEAAYLNRSNPTTVTLAVDIHLPAPLPTVTINDPIVQTVTVTPDADGKAVLTIPLAKARKIEVFTLPAQAEMPFRIVVDVLKRFSREEQHRLSPAITSTRIERQTDDRYLVAHLLEINTRDPHVRIAAVAALGERELVSAMVQRTGAVTGVNGGYFINGTRPVGLLKVDEQVLSLPLWERTTAAFPAAGPPVLLNPRGLWRVTLPDGTTLDAPDALEASIAAPPPAVVVYAGNLRQTPAVPNGMTARVRDGAVTAVGKESVTLAAGEWALVLRDEQATKLTPLLTVGAAVTRAPLLIPVLTEYPSAVGAGPRLLRNGKSGHTGVTERFKPDILVGRNSRTALGVTANGRTVLAVVEAPGPYGGGMTLDEVAALLKSRGVIEAMNLDGGGSSCLVVGSEIVNCPLDAWVRPVASGVLVYDDRIQSR